ncbi:hypothetical protein FSZ31_03720 [Sphingorhabdus soli]|uniref:LPXTG cell wall anchor domain-containing protein n=1 Tax=Flavisphingopyxis soli TaxID=2601267 RepID=A0A5C6USV8_9SPHN|nr:hypothetical protein [Sphingorhabdus soli]TXC73845.1 hypothetical protein FSZ31_03720 [Sphingorhabdus soli]
MTKNHTHFRPAMTAIAAVLASTPLAVAAQTVPADAGTPPAMSAPAPAPVAQPVIMTEPVATKPVATTAPAPAPRSTIAPEALRQIADAAIADAAATPAPRAKQVASTAAPRAAPVTPRSTATTPSAADETIVPVAAELPVEAVAPAPLASDTVTPAPEAAPQQTISTNDNALVTGGLIGLGLLGIGGLAFALRRRRSDEALPAEQGYEPARRAQPVAQPAAPVYAAAAAPVTPALVRAPTARPAIAGSHVERAMRGPTPDNPFLTLRKRLARARFLDKREGAGAAGFGGMRPALA